MFVAPVCICDVANVYVVVTVCLSASAHLGVTPWCCSAGFKHTKPSSLLAHYITVVRAICEREVVLLALCGRFCLSAVFWCIGVCLEGLYVTSTALMRLPMFERLLVWGGGVTLAGVIEVCKGTAVPTCAHLSLVGEGGKVVAE